MKSLKQRIGLLNFWLGWPVWFVYFKLNSRRARVLVVCDNKLLFNKTIVGDGRWGLPGGGAKRDESNAQAALRELQEEVGIVASTEDLQPLGDYWHSQYGLSFRAYFFALKLTRMPELTLQKHEISDAIWLGKSELATAPLNADSRHAVEQYGETLLG